MFTESWKNNFNSGLVQRTFQISSKFPGALTFLNWNV